jgi:hypothetical protein
MIKRFLILSLVVFLLLPIGSSFASVPGEAEQVIKKNMGSIANDMKSQPGFWKLKDVSEVPVSPGLPYQVYDIDLQKAKALAKNYKPNTFSSLIKPDYYWEYPLLDKTGKVVSSANIAKESGVWTLIGVGRYLPTELILFSASETEITDYLSGQGISSINVIKHLRAEALHTDFIYVGTEQGEYLVPLFSAEGALGLENKKVYPAADVLAKIAVELNKPSTDAQGNLLYSGGIGNIKTVDDRSILTKGNMAIASILALTLLGILFFMFRRQKRRVSNI